jgi:hypothetical protein
MLLGHLGSYIFIIQLFFTRLLDSWLRSRYIDRKWIFFSVSSLPATAGVGMCVTQWEMRTETKSGQGFTAGVKDYRLTYYMKDYRVHMNDILAAFRVIAQPGVPAEEAGAAIAAESSTGTWTTVWTDGLTSLDR